MMTIASICLAYFIIVLSITRLVHVLRIQEVKMRESQTDRSETASSDMRGNSRAAASTAV